ncbi:MAG: hypothetical protein ABID71_01995 [Chloroflexota bacterium]
MTSSVSNFSEFLGPERKDFVGITANNPRHLDHWPPGDGLSSMYR